MRPARTARMIPVLMGVCLLTLSAPAQYSGGTGEPNDPYQIATAADLIALGETPDDYDKHFILTADIDLDPNLPGRKVFDRAVIAPDTDADEPWPDEFQGTPFSGVFDGQRCAISHLTIEGGSYLGLFGRLGSGAIISSLGMEAVDVNGTGHSVGGLVGENYDRGTITNCYSTGTVSGDTGIGGLVGGNDHGSVTNCYSTGTVNGNYNVGGLVGWNGYNVDIANCYSTGTVNGDYRVGGLVGMNVGSITSSVWDIQTSGFSGSAGGVGLTTAEMMDPYMLGLNGFANDPNWVLDAGHDYPRLAWEGSPGQIITEPEVDWLEGSGTAEAPYRIDTSDQLILLGKAGILWDQYFILGADIDMDPNLPGGRLFTQAVIPRFTGVFDGNDHTISHLTIEGGSYLGLFGQLDSGAIISSLGMEAVDVNGTGHSVGGLVGGNDEGSVTNCYSNDSVNGDGNIGGLVGGNLLGSITQCYSTGTVNGDGNVGGLVGWNLDLGSITHCYSTGTVNGNSNVGGLVGGNADLRSTTSSFWDVETSGQTTSAGGMGLTTAEMMDPYLFALNGFADGPNWVLDAGHDYPRLAWEGSPGQIITEPEIDWLQGSGTADAPYRIDTSDQLILLSKAGMLWERHFVLGADIDMDPNLPGGRLFTQAVIPRFTGVFDGNDHTISHLTIEGGSYLGLFGELGSGAIVSNLGMQAVDVNGTGDCVGGLMGGNDDGSVTNCYSNGSVNGDGNVGGLVGENLLGTITHCYSTGTVSGDAHVGGLVGENFLGSITHCYSTGTVNGNGNVGGLAGENGDFGTITHCYSTGTVNGNYNVGGLVGWDFDLGNTTSSFWDVETSGQTTSAGGMGLTTAEMMDPYLLGLNGFGNDPNWVLDPGRDYPHLAWEGTPGDIIPEPGIDWLTGQGTAESPYRLDTADQFILLSKASILWDQYFVLTADIDLDPALPCGVVFAQAVIPVFKGTFDGDRHTISHLTVAGGGYLGFVGRLEGEIKDLGVVDVNVVGSGAYLGGLVGYCFSGGVTRCYSTGTVSGDWYAGGLVGMNRGSITHCYSTGTVSGDWSVGGLVGRNTGSITYCYSTGAVSGDRSVGGLVGGGEGSISNCYSTGTVNGNYHVGGLVGYASRGMVTQCYSVGTVTGENGVGGLVGSNESYSKITKSLWDVETSSLTNMCGRQADDAAGCDDSFGKTTAEMQNASAFLDAGWDFVGETENGTDDIWWILEGQDYPRLWWELPEEDG